MANKRKTVRASKSRKVKPKNSKKKLKRQSLMKRQRASLVKRQRLMKAMSNISMKNLVSPVSSDEQSSSSETEGAAGTIVKITPKPVQISHESAIQLKKILELIVHYDPTKFDIYKRSVPLQPSGIKVQRKKDIIYSLHSCMVSKRYLKAAKLLDLLALEITGRDHIFYHGTFKTMENSTLITKDHVQLFIRNVLRLPNLNKKEVLLDYIMFKMRNRDFEPPKDIIQKVMIYRNMLVVKPPIDALFLSYCALYEYISWVKTRSLSINGEAKSEAIKHKEKFTSEISNVISQEGVWDIFVIKSREMFEYYNELDECEEMLEIYLYSNLDHLHAHFYLYDFLKKHDRESEKQTKALQEIVNLSPSDILAVDYASLLMKENNRIKAVSVLFEFLEYPQNKDNVLAWEMMKHIGIEALEESDESDILKAMRKNWKKRSSYWPYYHFDQHTAEVDSKEKRKCVVYKCAFLSLVARSSKEDLNYIDTIKNLLQISGSKQLRKLNKTLRNIQNLQSRKEENR